jgi:hypothetical protein
VVRHMRDRRALAALFAFPLLMTAGCAQQSCGSVAVLDYLDTSDYQANISHVGLVRNSVRTMPGPRLDGAQCLVWERIRGPAPDQIVLVAQSYSVRRIGNGWQLSP